MSEVGSENLAKGRERVTRLDLVAGLWLLCLGLLLFWLSFQKWGHPIVDLGRDLYVPSRLLAGDWLYRDILYNYGPLAPYLLAGVTAIVGDSLAVFAACGIFCGLSTTLALYLAGRRLAGPLGAVGCATMFVGLHFFASSGGGWGTNFVLPYSYSAVLGLMFTLWSFYVLLIALERAEFSPKAADRSYLLSGLLLLAACFSKRDIAIAGGVVHGVVWLAGPFSRRVKWTLAGLTVALPAVFVWAFHARSPEEFSLLSENLTKFSGSVLSMPFFQQVSGMADLPGRLRAIGLGVGCIVGVGACLYVTGRCWQSPGHGWRRVGSVAAASLGTVALGGLLWQAGRIQTLAVVPVLALAGVVVAVRSKRFSLSPLFLASLLVLGSSVRIVLNYTPHWYGFYLSVPGYLLIAAWLNHPVCRRFRYHRVLVGATVFAALLMLVRFEREMLAHYGGLTERLVTRQGMMADLPIRRAQALRNTLDWLEARAKAYPDPTLLVVPEGVSLNYFSGLRNPIGAYLFIPPEIPGPAIEARLLDRLRRMPPDFVAVTSRDVTDFGATAFGDEYGRDLAGWIVANYRHRETFGDGRQRQYVVSIWERQ